MDGQGGGNGGGGGGGAQAAVDVEGPLLDIEAVDGELLPPGDYVFGLRQAVRRTSHEHRESSSVSPGQITAIERLLEIVGGLIQRASHLLVLLTSIASVVASLKRRAVVLVGAARSHMEVAVERYQDLYRAAALFTSWVACYAQILLMDARDACFFLRPANRGHCPRINRTIDEFSRSQFLNFTGFRKHQFLKLETHWRMPESRRFTHRRQHFPSQACMIIFLYAIKHTATYIDMSNGGVFGGDPRDFSPMMKLMTGHLYNTFYHKISGDSLSYWINRDNIYHFRRGTYEAFIDGGVEETHRDAEGNVVDQTIFTYENTPFDTWRVFSFIDDLGVLTCNVGEEPMRDNEFAYDIQRAYYSGYFRGHGLKTQVLLFPNGMVGSVFVAALRHNDNGMVNLSGLSQYLHSLLLPYALPSNLLPCAYGDGIFTLLPTIIPRFKRPNDAERRYNIRMSSLRMFEEHIFGDFKTMFPIFHCRHRLRLFENGIFVRQLIVVCFFVYNCRQCFTQSRTRLFNVNAPTIEACLPLDEELEAPPTVDLGELNDYQYGGNNRPQAGGG